MTDMTFEAWKKDPRNPFAHVDPENAGEPFWGTDPFAGIPNAHGESDYQPLTPEQDAEIASQYEAIWAEWETEAASDPPEYQPDEDTYDGPLNSHGCDGVYADNH
jgi:hypothetical protein